jgi:hypothetical protein
MNREVGLLIRDTVGSVEDIDVASDGMGLGKFLCVTVEVDVGRPLARGCTIDLEGMDMWVSFQYKKLPRICFQSGVIKHRVGGCSVDGLQRFYGGAEKKPFGS